MATSAREPTAALHEELAELIASGVITYVATRDADLLPEAVMAVGLRTHSDRCGFTVYVPATLAGPTLANLADNGQIAVTLTRPVDHKSVQLKGRARQIRDSEASDRDLQAIYRAALVEQFAVIGIPRSATRRIVWWPSVAIEVAVESVFTQTPGPRAGEPLTEKWLADE